MKKLVFAAILAVLYVTLAPATGASSPLKKPRGATHEIRSARTANATAWALRGGQEVTRISATPVRWRDGQGRWRPFDFLLRLDPDLPGYGASVGTATIAFPAMLGPGADQGVTVSSPGGRITSILERAEASAVARDETVTYDDALRGVDVKLRAVPEGLKEELILADASADRAFSYRLKLSRGLSARVASDGAVVVTRAATRVFVIPAPSVVDSAVQPAWGPTPRYRLSRIEDGEYRLRFAVSDAWLDHPGRAWPVIVDPTTAITTRSAPSASCLEAWRLTETAGGGQPRAARLSEDCNNPNRPSIALGGTSWTSGPTGLWQHDYSVAKLDFPSLSGYSAVSDIVDSASLVLHKESESTAAGSGIYVQPVGSSATPDRLGTVPATEPTGTNVAVNVLHIVSAWQERRGNAASGYPQGPLEISREGTWDIRSRDPLTLDSTNCAGCPFGTTTIATPAHADLAKRPYLEVTTIPAAPAGSRITTPLEGAPTARRVPLVAHGVSSLVRSVRFQYVAGSRREWRDIPLAALRFARPHQGTTTVSSHDIPVTAADQGIDSVRLIWDLHATPGGDVDGSVHVRAIFDETNQVGGGASPAVNFRVDRRNPEASSSTTLGPGEVDLLTGDFTMTTKDVQARAWLADFAVTRTFHSRGTSTRDTEMFGPHWAASYVADGGAMPYKRIYNYREVDEEQVTRWVQQPRQHQFDMVVDMPSSERCIEFPDANFEWQIECEEIPNEPLQVYTEFTSEEWTPVTDVVRWEYDYAQLELADGAKVTFRHTVNSAGIDTGWVPDPSRPGMRITKLADSWVIVDEDGVTTTFRRDAVDSPSYHPVEHRQPGSTTSPTFTWSTVDGRLRLVEVASARVNSDTNERRYLRFGWERGTNTGNQPRVTSIYFGRWDPSLARIAEVALASYGYDSEGRLTHAWDPRLPNGGISTRYAYDRHGRLESMTPAGENAWTFKYRFVEGDANPGRLESITRAAPGHGPATWSIRYDVPLSGTGAPAQMTRDNLAQWAQVDGVPTDATAVFPPSQVPASQPTDWTKATVHYLDVKGLEVNTLAPGGPITTVQYDDNRNVMSELTDENRRRALASPNPPAVAPTLMTVHRYDAAGVNEVSTLGPTHQLYLRDTDSVVRGRVRALTNYDEGKPPTIRDATNLPTTTSSAVLYDDVNGRTVTGDLRVTEFRYDAPGTANVNRGWEVRAPTKVIVDPNGLALTTSKAYHATLPLLVEERAPGNSRLGHRVRRYRYYGVDGTCPASTARVAGLLCEQSTDVASGQAPLPVERYSYDSGWSQTRYTETVGAQTRTTTTTYNAGGRQLTELTGDPAGGTATGRVSTTYDPATGKPAVTEDQLTGARITRTYDALGRLASYTDAHGTTTTLTYNIDGYVSEESQPGRTTRFTYNARGLVESMLDSTLAGPITGTYDGDGDLIEQTLPNGLRQRVVYDEMGLPRSLSYTKDGCRSNCVWVKDEVVRDSLARIVESTDQDGDRLVFRYDRAGRIETVHDLMGGGIWCDTRLYTYDDASNRLTRTEYGPGWNGGCTTLASALKSASRYTYDSADRAVTIADATTTERFAYDAKGRTTSVPALATDTVLRSTYFADDRVRTLTQDGLTRTYDRDPLGRVRIRTTSGTSTGTERYHYAHDEEDAPYLTVDAGTSTWAVEGLDEGLVATSDGTTAKYHLSDLRGHVVAIASDSTRANAPTAWNSIDEFGVPKSSRSGRYAWHGKHRRGTELPSGTIEMGTRTYVPQLGRFLEVDPVDGGSANAYDYANQDPVNNVDLDGDAWGILIRLGPPVVRGLIKVFGPSAGRVVTSKASGIFTPIKGFTSYGMKRVLGRDGGRGVNPFAIRDAMLSPIGGPKLVWRYRRKFDHFEETMVYRGRYAKVVLNRRGEVITAHALKGSGKRGVLRPKKK